MCTGFFVLKYRLFIVFFVFLTQAWAQPSVDSLKQELSNCKTENCKIALQWQMLEEFIYVDEIEGSKLAERLYFEVKEYDTVNYLNAAYYYGTYAIRLNQLNKAFTTLSQLKLKSQEFKKQQHLAKANYALGKYYLKTNDYKTAIDLFFSSLKDFEKQQDQNFIASAYFQIGLINYKLKNIAKAIEFYNKSLELAKSNRFSSHVAAAYVGLGNIYSNQNNNDLAIEYYERALKIRRSRGHDVEVAVLLANLGTVFSAKKLYTTANKYYFEAIEINKKYNRLNAIAICYINIGNISYNNKDFVNAEKYYDEALKYVDQNDLAVKENLYYNLAEVAHKLGNYPKSFAFQDSCLTIKDSIYSREGIKSLNDMQTKYETAKTKLELEKKELEANNKQLIIYAALGGCLLLIGVSFLLVRGVTKQRHANNLLSEKNSIIELQKHLVEEKNKDINDSIKYATRIQEAILPPLKYWRTVLPDSFVLYQPKDILSGDFYWLEQTEEYVFVAAADCTGHGVPGALMSIVNYNLLNKAVLEKNIYEPGKILDTVNEYLTQSLHQSYNESSIQDGMDITLVSINKKSGEVRFAGANNPIYHLKKDGRIIEVKGDKFPVGAFIEDNIQKFTTQKLDVEKGDTIYLFTDGYPDQFGGPKGKKLKYKQFCDLLVANCQSPPSEQANAMKHFFNQWKGNLEQVDDVCVIGVKI
jgi:serine phosphatase RsbU (regulator of sigma subunit)/Tfp pilus assembly protein PilF